MSDSAVEQVSLAELLDMHFQHHQVDLHVALPARVERYDTATQTVDVVPQVNRALPDGAGNFVTEPLPKLADVPVLFPRCGRFSITFPLSVGDFVLLVFAERSLAAWRATGAQSDPGDLGMHTLDGAVALPGLFPDAQPAAAADGANMRVGSDTDPNGRIELPGSEIRLGQGASKGIARVGDSVQVTIPTGAIQASGPTLPASPVIVTGTIASASAHAKAVD